MRKIEAAHSDAISCMALAHSGFKLVTGGHDTAIKVWDLRQIGTQQDGLDAADYLLTTIENAHQKKYDEGVQGMAIHPSQSCLVTGGADSII